jgi:hypothetical protein
MGSLKTRIKNDDRMAPIADDNIQLRRILWWVAQGSYKASSVTTAGVGTTSGTILEADSDRAEFSIQNVGTNPLFVKFGADASATNFNVVLAAGVADKDGKGGFLSSDRYDGVVSVYGTDPKYVVSDF